MGSSLTAIGSLAFFANQLASVTIPNSVTALDPSAFFLNSTSYSVTDTVVFGGAVSLEEYYSTLVYTRLYTEDSLNLQGFTDSLIIERDMGQDFSGDGDLDDSVGGYIVNLASVTASFEDEAGGELAPSETFRGTNLSTYLVVDNPANNLDLYFRIGSTQAVTPPPISGFTSPAVRNILLSSDENLMTFVNIAASQGGSSSDNASNNGGLVETGESPASASVFAIVLMTGSLCTLLQRKVSQTKHE